MDSDVKILSEFLSYLQTDTVRGSPAISSLLPAQLPSRAPCAYLLIDCIAKIPNLLPDYVTKLRDMNHPLRLLTENEIFRLSVWANPTNDPKRGTDVIGTALTEVMKTTGSSSP